MSRLHQATGHGAARVRTLLLDPTQCLPPTLILRLGNAPLSLPLSRPEAVVLASSEATTVTASSQISAVFGLGMHWGQVVVVLPFANDEDGRAYERLAELDAEGRMTTLHFLSIQDELVALAPRGTQRAAFLEDQATGEVHWIARRPEGQGLTDLASGHSPYLLAPPIGAQLRKELPSETRAR